MLPPVFRPKSVPRSYEQVELDVAAAPDQLAPALLRRPGRVHVAADDARIDFEEGGADVAGEGEVGVPVAGVEIVVEDAADAARLVAVLEEEILVAPFLEARVVGGVVAGAGGLERGVEIGGIQRLGKHRRQVGAAAEPADRCDDMAGVHMHGRHQRRLHVGDEADAACPELPASAAPGICLRNSSEKAPWTVEMLTPTFSKTRPRITAITPPPPSPAVLGRAAPFGPLEAAGRALGEAAR